MTSRLALPSLLAIASLTGCLDADATFADSSAALTAEIVPLAQAAALAPLEAVCPPARADALCIALRGADDAGARTAAAALIATDKADPALHFYLRERQVALLVWNALTERGHRAPPVDYAAAATAFLAEHYPAYADGELAMARRPLPPLDATTCTRRDALVYFPGVLRLESRTELQPQAAALAEAVPCLDVVVVDTEDFMDPEVNAAVAKRQIDALPGAPALHFIGYSQGVRNLLQALVTYPDLAARAATVLTMNSAAHGSEAIDVLFLAMQAFEAGGDICAAVPPYVRASCEQLAGDVTDQAQLLARMAAAVLGVPADEIIAGIAGSAPVAAVREYLRGHLAGWKSLTTFDSQAFWAAHGDQLPRDLIYTAFRTTISRPEQNLPPSNAPLYAILTVAGGAEPWNDMQVLLKNHTLGGPVGETEVALPVAEGNHWQWEFLPGQLDPALITSEMVARVPQLALTVAYGQLLFETGAIR